MFFREKRLLDMQSFCEISVISFNNYADWLNKDKAVTLSVP